LPSDEAVAAGVQLCDAVAAVHGAGVLHRDIKAANAVIKADGTVVLMDFGAGQSVEGDPLRGVTGTPLYLAPEVLDGEQATVRSDIYSLGVLLHYVLTGGYPVTATSLSELRLAHRRRTEAWESGKHRLDSRIPSSLRPLLERALDPKPEGRQERVTALAEELRGLQRAGGARRWRLRYAAALIVAAVGAGAFLTGGGESSQPERLAILPFAVSGGGADTHVFREGVTRDLIAHVERYDDVRVIATTSVFSDDVLELPLREIGKRLGVSYVLTGQLTHAGTQLAAEVRLVRTSDEQVRWSTTYNRPASELLDLNRAIAADLIEELDLRKHVANGGTPPRNPEAYSFYVRGQAALDTFAAHSQRAAKQLFEQALAIDPNYAQAHAGMARVYLNGPPQIAGLPAQEAMERASAAAARALQIDPSLPDAYVAAAVVKSARSDWNGAEADYRHAIAIAPNNVLALQEYAHWLSLHGRFEEALKHAEAAESRDPLSPRAIVARASVLRFARRYDEALAATLKALDINPLYPAAQANAGHCYEGLGRMNDAVEAFQRWQSGGNLAHAYGRSGRVREARALIALLEERYAREGVGAGEVAQGYIGLGELESAFEWLERMGHRWPTTLKVAAVWDPLRPDPRFKRLLQQRGLDR
jgi:TolB-like protein/Tfp pilus assembly protein PilF